MNLCGSTFLVCSFVLSIVPLRHSSVSARTASPPPGAGARDFQLFKNGLPFPFSRCSFSLQVHAFRSPPDFTQSLGGFFLTARRSSCFALSVPTAFFLLRPRPLFALRLGPPREQWKNRSSSSLAFLTLTSLLLFECLRGYCRTWFFLLFLVPPPLRAGWFPPPDFSPPSV